MCLPHACAVTWSLVRRVGHQIKVKFVQQGHQTILKRNARDLMAGWWYTYPILPLWKIWKSVGIITFPIDGKCSKALTRWDLHVIRDLIGFGSHWWHIFLIYWKDGMDHYSYRNGRHNSAGWPIMSILLRQQAHHCLSIFQVWINCNLLVGISIKILLSPWLTQTQMYQSWPLEQYWLAVDYCVIEKSTISLA